jgi:hypothetical protein
VVAVQPAVAVGRRFAPPLTGYTVRTLDGLMRRIHVTGNAGVGKSTLAERIGVALDLPTFGLDQVVWKPGWGKTGPRERTTQERALCARPSWVIEGVSRIVRESADLIVFLDYPRSVSLWRSARAGSEGLSALLDSMRGRLERIQRLAPGASVGERGKAAGDTAELVLVLERRLGESSRRP